MVFSVINKLHIPWFQGINKVALSFIFIFRGSSGILVLLSILRKWVSWFYFSSFDWRQFLGFSFIACGRIILKVLDLMMRKWMFFFKVFPSEKFDFFFLLIKELKIDHWMAHLPEIYKSIGDSEWVHLFSPCPISLLIENLE